MKQLRTLLGRTFIIGGLIAATGSISAQTTAMPIQVGTFTLTGTNVSSLESLPDWQLKAVLQALATTPLIEPDALPDGGSGGNYYSLLHPEWPPLPGDVRQIPVWGLESGSGSDSYLLDDLDNPTDPGDTNNWVEGGFTTNDFQSPVFTTNDLWLELLSVSDGTANLIIHPPWTETNGVHDLYYTTNLDAPIAWQWLLRTEAGQTNVMALNASDALGFYQLGPPDDLAANDSLGTNFWVAFFSLYDGLNNHLSLYISSSVGATGTVTIPGFGITNAFSVAAGAVTNISITNTVEMTDYGTIETNGIHIASSGPISVYGVSYWQAATAAFTVYPTPLLGTNYCLMAYEGYEWTGGYNWRSQFAILASEDDTTVTIMPSPTADLFGHSGTNAYTEVLQRGGVYQIESYYNADDVTGTWVQSDKPIAIFAGSYGAVVPSETGWANPLVQEQMPVETWGTQALSVGFAGRQYGDTYRVLAAYSNTVVTITTTNLTNVINLAAGMFCETILGGPVEFQATQPIQVAHFANGSYFDLPPSVAGNQYEGDPCEILLPPTGHYLETNVVITLPDDYETGDFDENFLNLIVPQAATNSTYVDSSLVVATNFVAIGTSGYYGAQITITNSGTNIVTSSQPVRVEVYGWGERDAYGYLGGIVK